MTRNKPKRAPLTRAQAIEALREAGMLRNRLDDTAEVYSMARRLTELAARSRTTGDALMRLMAELRRDRQQADEETLRALDRSGYGT